MSVERPFTSSYGTQGNPGGHVTCVPDNLSSIDDEPVVQRCDFIEWVEKRIVVVDTKRLACLVYLQGEAGILMVLIPVDEARVSRHHAITA